jgi:hypothetical protein
MRVLTRAVVALLVLGFIVVGALLVAQAAIGPTPTPPSAGTAGVSRPPDQNWKTHSSLLEGVPVGLSLGGDFLRAWIDMAGTGRLVAAGVGLVVLVLLAYLLRRLLRRLLHRHAEDPLPV